MAGISGVKVAPEDRGRGGAGASGATLTALSAPPLPLIRRPGRCRWPRGPRGLGRAVRRYAGVTLRRAGLAHGGSPDADAALDGAFAAAPFMLERF